MLNSCAAFQVLLGILCSSVHLVGALVCLGTGLITKNKFFNNLPFGYINFQTFFEDFQTLIGF